MWFKRFIIAGLAFAVTQPVAAIVGRAYLPFETAYNLWLGWAVVSFVFVILAGLFIWRI